MNRKTFWFVAVPVLIGIGILCASFLGQKLGKNVNIIGMGKEPSEFRWDIEILPLPSTDDWPAIGCDFFAFSPDGHQLAVAKKDFTFLRVFTVDFPIESSADYRKVVKVPNVSLSSPIAWCRENPTRLAFAAHFYVGPPIPEFHDRLEYAEWRKSHPERFPKGSVSVVQSDERIERRIAIVSIPDGSFTKDIEFSAVDGATNLGSICWPKEDTIFYNYGNTIFRVDLNVKPTKASVIYKPADKNTHIFHLGYDDVNDLLLCFRLSPQNSQKGGKLNYELLSLSADGKVVKTNKNIPFSETVFSVAYGQGGKECLALGEGSLYCGDLTNNRWQRLSTLEAGNIQNIMFMNAFDSRRKTAIVTMWNVVGGNNPYRQWSFSEEKEKK